MIGSEPSVEVLAHKRDVPYQSLLNSTVEVDQLTVVQMQATLDSAPGPPPFDTGNPN